MLTLLFLLSCSPVVWCLPEVIKIGALFEEGDEWSRYAFEAALKVINEDESTLPGLELQLETTEAPVPQYDIVGVENNVCGMMKSGIVGIVGPQSAEMSNHVQSLCDTMEIPHITARWDAHQRRSSCLVNLYPYPPVLAQAAADIVRAWNWKGFTIVYDDFNALRKIGELVKIADDKGYIVSVKQIKGRNGEDDNYRYVLQEIKHSGETNIVVEVARERLFDVMLQAQQVGLVGSEYSYIVTSLDFQSIDIEPFKWAGTNITGIRIVDPDQPQFKEVMKLIMELKEKGSGGGEEGDEAKEEGGEGEGEEEKKEEGEVGEGGGEEEEGEEAAEGEEEQLEEEDAKKRKRRQRRRVQVDEDAIEEPGAEEGENEPDETEGEAEGEEGEKGEEEEGKEGEGEGEAEGEKGEEGGDGEGGEEPPAEEEEVEYEIPPIEALLLYDAVKLIAHALHNLDLVEPQEIDCKKQSAWESGYSVINYIRMSEQQGLTGVVKFDYEGFRSEFVLEVVELVQEGLVVKGNWTKENGLTIHYAEDDVDSTETGEDLRNSTFIVLIALTHPYGMLKESSRQLTGNDRFEGFGIDLIHELSLMSGFNYTFRVQEDKSSGSPKTLENGTRVWSGMIGEVQAGRADLAIADITITRERERDADFTNPFMNLGISILYRKPMKAPPVLFSFLSPFSYEVWGYILSAWAGVSFLLFVMARISPYEWTNPYPCNQDPTELETQFSVSNSFWFTVGSLLQQGSEIAPISVSTRMVAAIWWFFTLIMVSSYTANLAAFLTIEQKIEPFTNVEGLANQDKIKYGAKKGGATANFFRDSKEPIYQKMYEFMSNNPDVMMNSNDEGVTRVQLNTDYAFLMESASIEYEQERKCELTRVGDLLDNKGYGIAMRQNASYRSVLSRNVIKLTEGGKLNQLKDKWWKEKRGGGACQVAEEGGEASELGLDNVGGVFVVLLGGCILAIFLSIGELLWDIYTREDKKSFKDELIEEIKFIARCHGTVKPIRKGGGSASGSKSGSRSGSRSASVTGSRTSRTRTRSKSKTSPSQTRSRHSGRLYSDPLSLD